MAQAHLQQALWEAVLSGEHVTAGKLLADGADPNGLRGTKSMLARAFECTEAHTACALLQHGAKIDSRAHGTTCWELCLERGWPQAMELFVQAGVDLDAPLGGAENHTPAGMAARRGDMHTIRWLAEHGARAHVGGVNRHTGSKTPTLSLWMERTPDLNEPHWWDGLKWLSSFPPQDNWPARLGGEVVFMEARHRGLGKRVLEILTSIPHWMDDGQLLNVAHNTMIYSGHLEWAGQLRRQFAVPLTAQPESSHGPWTRSALASAVDATRKEVDHPRRMSKALDLIDELVKYGADPDVIQNGMPLVFFAIEQKAPAPVLERLLDLGASAQVTAKKEKRHAPLKQSGENDPRQNNPTLPEGITLLHFCAQSRQEEPFLTVSERFPDFVNALDSQGLTPLFRCVVPYQWRAGVFDRRPLLPALQALRQAGSDPFVQTAFGDGILQALIHARRHFNVAPRDLDEVIEFIHQWAPGTFEQTNPDGECGWELLDRLGMAPPNTRSHALLRAQQMNQAFVPAFSAKERAPIARF